MGVIRRKKAFEICDILCIIAVVVLVVVVEGVTTFLTKFCVPQEVVLYI